MVIETHLLRVIQTTMSNKLGKRCEEMQRNDDKQKPDLHHCSWCHVEEKISFAMKTVTGSVAEVVRVMQAVYSNWVANFDNSSDSHDLLAPPVRCFVSYSTLLLVARCVTLKSWRQKDHPDSADWVQ